MTFQTDANSAAPGADPLGGPGQPGESSPADDAGEPFIRVLAEDLGALASDALNYLDAELAFQKTRARFVGNRLLNGLVFAIVAIVLVLLAAIGLTVGLIIALTPLVTAWGATAIVAGLLLLLAYLCLRRAQDAVGAIGRVFGDKGEAGAGAAQDDNHD